jgi:hypothetical protein
MWQTVYYQIKSNIALLPIVRLHYSANQSQSSAMDRAGNGTLLIQAMSKFKILDFNKDEDNCFDVPQTIAVCPYCNSSLSAQVTGWTESEPNSDLYIADSIDMTCAEEPDMEDLSDWDDFVDRHSEMPYVYWLPVHS